MDMANRRMFSNRIANSAKFLQMPIESQLLYFHLVLRSDDDGVVESYPIVKLLGVAPDAFKVLQAKRYIEVLNEDQVIVINDWQEHNTIRADRKVDSIYIKLLKEKQPGVLLIEPKPRSDVKDNSNRIDGPSTDGLSKVKLSKVKLSKENTIDLSFIENSTIKKQFEDWLEYKKSRNEAYKAQCSIRAAFNKLQKLSGDDPDIAKEIINESMANGWKGMFAVKTEVKKSKAGRSLDNARKYIESLDLEKAG